jgi:uncharacterized protein YggL (DUF469 family)
MLLEIRLQDFQTLRFSVETTAHRATNSAKDTKLCYVKVIGYSSHPALLD